MSRRAQNDYLNNFRIAFQAESTVNWDPVDKVVVADEEVENGRAWRSGALVVKRTLKQWFFRITAYAERLINDLEAVDWPERIVLMQRNWIGKSEGAEVVFRVAGSGHAIPVFTTRPDTLWGATFMVLSPEHPLVPEITMPERAPKWSAISPSQRARPRSNARRRTRRKPACSPAHTPSIR